MIRLLLVIMSAVAAIAELPAYRFVFVVDASQSMNSRKAAVIKNVRAIVHSAFDGQMLEGDTLEIWTFTDRLATHAFPAQRWTPPTSARIAELGAHFLQNERFTGRTRFDNVAPAITDWISTQTNALLILVTDGEDAVIGIPNDFDINEYINPRRSQARRGKRAFFAAMTVQNGRVTQWSAYDGLGSFDLPRLPVREAEPPIAVVQETVIPEPVEEPPPPPVLELPPGAKIITPEPPPVSAPPTAESPVEAVVSPSSHAEEELSTKIEATDPMPAPASAALSQAGETTRPTSTEPPAATPAQEINKKTATSTVNGNPAVAFAVVPPRTRFAGYGAMGAALILSGVLFRQLRRKPADGSLISKSLSQD